MMMGSRTASSLVQLAGSGTLSYASSSSKIHAARAHTHADAVSPSPCSPACNASAPAHLSHARASVSPNAQVSDFPSQILQQMLLGGYALISVLT
jgi:hypothetical protein